MIIRTEYGTLDSLQTQGTGRDEAARTCPRRDRVETVCSCEVKTEPNLSQALHLLNGNTISDKIQNGGVVKKLLKENKTSEEVIADLYLRCLSRPPTTEERRPIKRNWPRTLNARTTESRNGAYASVKRWSNQP